MPLSEGSAMVKWKERLAFLAACALIVAYVVSWALSSRETASIDVDTGRAQRYVLASGANLSLPEAGSVFASGESDAYFDGSIPMRWVRPKVVVEQTKPVEISLPKPFFRGPPMLLPIPGPAVEYSSSLPRWPAFPVEEATTP